MIPVEEFIREYLSIDAYQPSGLVWINHPSKYHATRLKGKPAGAINNGRYYRTSVKGRLTLNHRIVWFLHSGYWPDGVIDHIDGNTTNNNPNNLRDVTHSENSHNNSGRGYYFHKPSNKWLAQIRLNGKTTSLGYFSTKEEARGAYLLAKQTFHPTAPARCFHPK